jgi:hypothetical protein
MTQSGLRVSILFAETVKESSGLADFPVRLSQADRPVLNGLTFFRWSLGHIVVEVPAAEVPHEPAPARPLCHILSAHLFVGGNTEVCLAFTLVTRNVGAPQPIQNLARLPRLQ